MPWGPAYDALTLFESLEPMPTNQWRMAPVWLRFTADFRHRSPVTEDVWPGQDRSLFGEFETPTGVRLGASSTRLILQAKCSIGLSMSWASGTPSHEALVEALDSLEPDEEGRLIPRQEDRASPGSTTCASRS